MSRTPAEVPDDWTRVEDVPVVPGSAIGIIPNPMSGRDIRRLISQASVFPNTEKASMVLRIIRTAGTLGVETVYLSTDTFGIAAGVLREVKRLSGARSTAHIRWPKIEFLEVEHPTGTAQDTTCFARMMSERTAATVVLLGGDGTMRAAAPGLGDTPMLALSTGTNNAFPVMMEATVAGMALGLIATGRADPPTTRAKLLHVDVVRPDRTHRHESALVDVCVNTLVEVGSRAVWRADTLRELYCTFAEPHAIGLSSIPGRILPVSRTERRGVVVRLGPVGRTEHTVLAPLAPGVLEHVGFRDCSTLDIGVPHEVEPGAGTVALDGEREIEFGPADRVTVTLQADGPLVIEVPSVLASTPVS